MNCPSCNQKGKQVSTVTLASLLKPEFAKDLEWRFCDSRDCDVVYFSESETFTKPQVKVPVGIKERTGDRRLCYCFGHSVASIKAEIQDDGKSSALDDIRAKMENPGCRCETENPSGTCCLGSVASGIKIAQQELDNNRGERIAKISTLVSAVVASSCCWLPLVLLAVGASGAGIVGSLEAYRPLFVVATVGFLGTAFYFTYRPRESCCSQQTNKVMLWGVTVIALGFLFFPKYVGVILGSPDLPDDPTITKTTVAIDGMHCEGCSVVAENSIANVPGVLNVKVDYTNSQAIIATDGPLPERAVLSAIEDAGYSGRLGD